MASEEDFRDAIREAVRRHDPDPDQLRAIADALEERAHRAELTNEVI